MISQILIDAEKNLQCCGNCRNNKTLSYNFFIREETCKKNENSDSSVNHCRLWENDGLTQKKREIK
jgi:hypothetical protein